MSPDVREQCDLPRPLDRTRELPLVLRARAGHAAREHLALLRDEPEEPLLVLVVDLVDLVLAEPAELAVPFPPCHRALRDRPAVPGLFILDRVHVTLQATGNTELYNEWVI